MPATNHGRPNDRTYIRTRHASSVKINGINGAISVPGLPFSESKQFSIRSGLLPHLVGKIPWERSLERGIVQVHSQSFPIRSVAGTTKRFPFKRALPLLEHFWGHGEGISHCAADSIWSIGTRGRNTSESADHTAAARLNNAPASIHTATSHHGISIPQETAQAEKPHVPAFPPVRVTLRYYSVRGLWPTDCGCPTSPFGAFAPSGQRWKMIPSVLPQPPRLPLPEHQACQESAPVRRNLNFMIVVVLIPCFNGT